MKRQKNLIAEQLKSFVLMVLVGVLAGNLLAAMTEVASASSQSVGKVAAAVTEVHYKLEPSNPEYLRSVEFKAQTLEGDRPTIVRVSIEGQQTSSFTCTAFGSDSAWSCPLTGVKFADAAHIQFIAE